MIIGFEMLVKLVKIMDGDELPSLKGGSAAAAATAVGAAAGDGFDGV